MNKLQLNGMVRSFGAERDIDEAIETYKLAYLSAMLKKKKQLSIAGLTLRIAWFYRDKGEQEEEKRFLTIATKFIHDSYSEGIIQEHKCLKREFFI